MINLVERLVDSLDRMQVRAARVRVARRFAPVPERGGINAYHAAELGDGNPGGVRALHDVLDDCLLVHTTEVKGINSRLQDILFRYCFRRGAGSAA